MVKIGVIGGSGLDDPDILNVLVEVSFTIKGGTYQVIV